MSNTYIHPDSKDFELIAVLRALADPIRLGIIQHLYTHGEANCSTLLGSRPKSSMSHHFSVLRDSGILHTRVDGVNHRNTLRLTELESRFPGLIPAVINAVTSQLPSA